ncbi:heme exporter protein CcmD [Azohydromonas lata]|uniref:Heme exporter protein D n=1 Tax=Azohydromonas lata TaxID=45677 RepID=A0ABU5IPZ2_9BURK|nr:heme exporter protein CcmD [Azohydromonas lata]MDZ5460953.1 heme exporter protein CcmD [Azohydromonas lata]
MGIDWALLWDMGGHGLYVWGGWGLALLALGLEAALLWRRSRRLPQPNGGADAAAPAPGRAVLTPAGAQDAP